MKKIKELRILVLGGSSDIAYNLIIHYLKKGYVVDAHYNLNSQKLKIFTNFSNNFNCKINFIFFYI